MPKVVVIGGGASGLMAAYSAAACGAQVTIIEKNQKIGKKIYITGKGRCNVTNNVPPQEFLENVVTNKKFLIGALNKFTPQDTINFFESQNINLKTERGGRVFPVSDKASDITCGFVNAFKNLNITVNTQESVSGILTDGEKVTGVVSDKKTYLVDSVIIATGGLSYPATGSTGDGYRFAKGLGHNIVPIKPALCGIEVTGELYKNLQGLSLKNVKVSAYDCQNNKEIASIFGEMLFTHYGVSGPIILSLSSLISRSNAQKIALFIDLKPALSFETLSLRLLRDFAKNSAKIIANALDELLPKSLIEPIITLSHIPLTKKVAQITVAERESLVNTLKGLRLDFKKLRPIEECIVTAGGIDIKQVNPSTMQSKIIKNLYFCGEVLDVDGMTGGYNLQIAFSTGYLAGKSSANI